MKFFKNKTSKSFLFLIIGLISITNPAYSQAWQWANSLGGSSSDLGSATCTDPSGNVFIAGTFSSLSMNIGTVSIANAGGSDVFLAKFNSNGNYLWSQRIGGTGMESVGGICSDAAGRVYITGAFDSPSLSVSPMSVYNYTTFTTDAYAACFDGFGTLQWLRKYGYAGNETGGGIAYSNTQSSAYITGYFTSTILPIGTTTLTNASTSGSNDIFLIKLNNLGNPTWAIRAGGAASNDYGYSVNIDASNSYPYVAGAFSPTSAVTPTTQIGTTVLTSYGNQDIFISKFTDLGGFSWVRGCGGSSTTGNDYFGDLAVDGSNNPYITGYYFGAPFTAATTTLVNSGSYDPFIAKYNSAGTLQWANKVITGGTLSDIARSITVDGNNNIYVTGSFAGTVVGTSGAGNLTNSIPGSTEDIYVVKYNSAGVAQWATSAQGANYESGYGISSDAIGNVYVTGQYNIAGPTAFGTTTLSSAGGNDGFYAKIGCLTNSITGSSNVCTGSSATLTASGATSYTWSTGATTSSIIIAPSTNTVYTVNGSSGLCIGTPKSLSVTVLPASMSPGSNLNLLCKQKAIINATCSPAATLVTWSPATNLSNSSVLNPTATAGPGTTNYTVTTTLSNGCIKTGTVNVSSYAQSPDICQVTVDSLSVNNEIYWEKTLYPQADSFIIYREVSTNVYKRIAAVSRTQFSMYTDTNRSIGPANGDPNLTYYRYKMQIRDSCGNYSPLSKWHETIFIQDQLNGNFNWNMYAIESATSTPVSNYNLKRRMVSTGTETLITSTTGGLANDPLYNSFWPLNVKWFVDAVGFNCNATAKVMVLKTKTKSNQSNDKLAMGITNYALANNVHIYPNPASDILNIDLNGLSKTETNIEILNTLGQVVYQTKSLNQHLVVYTTDLAGGVYMVNIKQIDRIIAIKKVVISK